MPQKPQCPALTTETLERNMEDFNYHQHEVHIPDLWDPLVQIRTPVYQELSAGKAAQL